MAGAAGFPTIVKASALGKDGAVAPSDRIVMAGIGFGMMGPGNMANFLEKPEVQWVAVCDLDKEPLAMAKGMVDKKYGNKACATYHDFRELYPAQGPRRRVHRRARPLARHPGHLGPAGRARTSTAKSP
ncbi:MAG: hypothetical protein MZV64_12775 [Ignavibacteriales bacterium]|nr:hypothetical protein [Ignavibacteriales bacterium]